MSTLRDLQQQFQDYLLAGKVDFAQSIVSTERMSVETRLSIYGLAYRSRLHEALVHHYPVLQKYLGENAFSDIAHRYIDQCPSVCRSIRWFGDQLSHFLKQHIQYEEIDFLSELAQFEWLQTNVFDSADHAVLDVEEVGKIPPERWSEMRFTIHPSVHCIVLSWNVACIWQAVFDQNKPDEPMSYSSPITWILWRRDLMNYFSSLTEHEAWAIDVIMKHNTFGEMCEGLCEWFDESEVGVQAGSLLKKWIESGWLSEVVF